MGKYDFSGPYVSAVIINPDGSRYPLWTNQQRGSSSRSEDAPPSMPFLSNVTVEINQGYVPTISAELEPTFREGIEFLDTAFEWGQSQLEVQLGYVGGVSGGPILSTYTGTMLKPDVQIGEDIRITLNAQGVGGFSAVVFPGYHE